MADETISQNDAYVECIAATSISLFSFSLESSDTATDIPSKKLYPLIDFELVCSVAGTVFNIYRRAKGGIVAAAPTAANKQYVDSIILDALGTGYL